MKKIQRKLLWIYERKLVWSVVVICLTQIIGSLPMLDMLSPNVLKLASWGTGLLLTVAKCIEMYFDKTASLYEYGTLEDEPQRPDEPQGSMP